MGFRSLKIHGIANEWSADYQGLDMSMDGVYMYHFGCVLARLRLL